MIRANHPAIKFTSYAGVAVFCTLVGIWDLRGAVVICAIAFAVDGLLSNLLLAARGIRPDSRWLNYAVSLAAIAVGRSFAAVLGF